MSRLTGILNPCGHTGKDLPISPPVDHEQDWQPYPVDPYSATCDDDTYTDRRCMYTRYLVLFKEKSERI